MRTLDSLIVWGGLAWGQTNQIIGEYGLGTRVENKCPACKESSQSSVQGGCQEASVQHLFGSHPFTEAEWSSTKVHHIRTICLWHRFIESHSRSGDRWQQEPPQQQVPFSWARRIAWPETESMIYARPDLPRRIPEAAAPPVSFLSFAVSFLPSFGAVLLELRLIFPP